MRVRVDSRVGPGGERSPSMQQSHRVGTLGFIQVAGRNDDSGTVGSSPGDQPPQIHSTNRINAGRDLIEYKQIGSGEQRHRSGELAPLAPG